MIGLKLPDGYSTGILFDWARGHSVDVFAKRVGLVRKRWFVFRESDRKFKQRIIDAECRRRGLIE